MPQRQAKHDTVAEQGEAFYRKFVRYAADGYIDQYEQADLRHDARLLAISTQLQATRFRLVRRMISGGDMDREILCEVRDYMDLQRKAKTSSGWTPLEAKDADQKHEKAST